MAKQRKSSYVGVDLGGTKILAAVADEDGAILGSAKRRTLPSTGESTTPVTGPEVVIDRIIRTVQEAIAAAGLKSNQVKGLGIGAPGPVNVNTGEVLVATNLPGWPLSYALGPELSRRLDLPVVVENDVNMATLGEAAFGAGHGVKDVVGIFVGTGIGGGLILNGQLRRGYRWAAGEIGHMTIDLHGPLCGCGRPGHVEALASRGAISRALAAALAAGETSSLNAQGGAITSGAIRKALDAGDPLVTRVLTEAQEVLGKTIAAIVNLLDPECVIMGGGLIESLGESFLAPMRTIARAGYLSPVDAGRISIVPAALGDNAGVLGGIVLASKRPL